MSWRGLAPWIGGLVILAVIFQLFFRYAFIQERYGVLRVDRLTGSSCSLPCELPTTNAPASLPPAPTPSPPNYGLEDQEAIVKAKNHTGPFFYDSLKFGGRDPADFKWAVTGRYTNEGARQQLAEEIAWDSPPPGSRPLTASELPSPPPGWTVVPSPKPNEPYPVRLVCYCDSKGWGWRWEVHLDTNEVFDVGDNRELLEKYHIK